MTIRFARHTDDLEAIRSFYIGILGFELLGGFESHNGYDGIFIGFPNAGWHLEFTASAEKAVHHFGEDDILVLYPESQTKYNALLAKLSVNKILFIPSKNPYWNENGKMFLDPDGYRIIVSGLKAASYLASGQHLTALSASFGITEWKELLQFVRQLPYGRNSNRIDLSLVLTENKGTCSSKHAFLKKVAEENNIQGIELIMGIFKMTELNVPKIGKVLSENKISYLPEAHCYLKINGMPFDFTSSDSLYEKIKNDILEEVEIEPYQVSEYKIEYHKNYLKNWLASADVNITFERLWEIREKCIRNLSR
ncbi:MAG TPA: VOC family protein [Flavobacterium sp.]|nr:VOC family protein [Flavobacterium sp.]